MVLRLVDVERCLKLGGYKPVSCGIPSHHSEILVSWMAPTMSARTDRHWVSQIKCMDDVRDQAVTFLAVV
jgi:hypothetical protein